MGMSADHWVGEHDGHRIEVEAFRAGFMAVGCALFVDDTRVDAVPHFKTTFTAFSLRHKLRDGQRDTTVSVKIRHRLIRTEAQLSIDGKPVQMNRAA